MLLIPCRLPNYREQDTCPAYAETASANVHPNHPHSRRSGGDCHASFCHGRAQRSLIPGLRIYGMAGVH